MIEFMVNDHKICINSDDVIDIEDLGEVTGISLRNNRTIHVDGFYDDVVQRIREARGADVRPDVDLTAVIRRLEDASKRYLSGKESLSVLESQIARLEYQRRLACDSLAALKRHMLDIAPTGAGPSVASAIPWEAIEFRGGLPDLRYGTNLPKAFWELVECRRIFGMDFVVEANQTRFEICEDTTELDLIAFWEREKAGPQKSGAAEG